MYNSIILFACVFGLVYIFSTSLQAINKSFRVMEIRQIINEIKTNKTR